MAEQLGAHAAEEPGRAAGVEVAAFGEAVAVAVEVGGGRLVDGRQR